MLARRRVSEKKAQNHKVKLVELTIFTQQLASMINAGLPLLAALGVLEEQVSDPVFQVIIHHVRNDIAAGNSFSSALRKFPRAFNSLFIAMVEAGEASGALVQILEKVGAYFESMLKLMKKVKSAMTYPIAVIGLSIVIVNVLLIFVIPTFAEMFEGFDAQLPRPTLMLIATSEFLKRNIVFIILAAAIAFKIVRKLVRTPGGRVLRDRLLLKLPIVGSLCQKIALSRFCRTYAILMRSGVPILKSLEICSTASGNTFIESACADISRHVSQGGQVSEIIGENHFFPPMLRYMAKAGEQTGNVDGMMVRVADFYDTEIDATVAALTSLMEPAMIVILGVIIGGIVICMFLPIFQLSQVVSP